MKEKDIRHVERNLSFKRIKSQKKYSALILCITILTCMLMQVSFQMTAGIQETLKENRKAIYGEWGRILTQTDEATRIIINDNPFLKKKGIIKIYGVVDGDYWENMQSNIGTIDEAAWELGRLDLRAGRLPKSNNEIAMEYSMLLALGYEGIPGEKITLKIIPSLEYRSEEKPKEFIYTLCGVIKDYQINWETSTRNRLPTGIVSLSGAEQIGDALETHMLIQAKDGYESVYDELKNSGEISCGMEENFNRGSLVTDNIPFEKFLNNIRILVAGAAVCILFITLSHSIDTRENFWKFLHALGMKKEQMYQMIIWEAGIYGIISILFGTLGGITLYKATLPLFETIIGKPMVIGISPQASAKGMLYSILIISISYIFSCMRLNKYLKEGGKQKNQKCFRKKKAYTVSKFTPLSVVLQQWRYARIRKAIQILLLTSTIVIAWLGLLETTTKQKDLKMFKQMTGNGYYLDTSGVPNSKGLRKTMVQALTQIAGIDSIEGYYDTRNNTDENNTKFTVDLSKYSDSRYVQEIVNTEQYYQENAGLENAAIDKVTLSAFGIAEWEDIERFAKNLSEGTLTRTDFEHGDYCILLLPPLQEVPEGYLGNSSEEAYKPSFLTESHISLGDMLKITHWKRNGEKVEQQIPIDGIIRTEKQTDIRSPHPGWRGISIIAGVSFWGKFQINAATDYYQQVRINISDDADALDTEKNLLRNLKKMGTLNLHNFHQEYKEKQQDMFSFIGMYSIFTVFYMILTFIVLYQMLETETQERAQKTKIFKALGMEDSFITKMRRIEILLMICFAVIGSMVVIGCYYMIKFKM